MLFSIYLGTTAVSWTTIFIFSAAYKKKLERKGYKIVNEKSFEEKIASFISTAFKGSIPIYNIINAIFIICAPDKVYELIENRLLDEGKIYMPKDEPTDIQAETESSAFEKEQNYTDGIQKVNCEKKYENMSFEEKIAYLQKAQEMLLRQKASISDESLSENLGKQKPVLKKIEASKINSRRFK